MLPPGICDANEFDIPIKNTAIISKTFFIMILFKTTNLDINLSTKT